MSSLSGKIVVVTGGGSGVGLATARLLLSAGAKVAISGRDAAKLATASTALGGGDTLLAVPCDVSDPAAVKAFIEQVTTHFGRIDILVNNAGTNLKARTMRELSAEGWSQLIRTNLDGAFYCTSAVLPQMLARKEGLIVNVVSTAGKRAHPLAGAAYAASKFGMAALGLCLGAEERESGLRVSNIYPGEIDTPILAQRPTPVTEEQRAKILKSEDVATAILFVCTLPPHVNVPELIIKPTTQLYY